MFLLFLLFVVFCLAEYCLAGNFILTGDQIHPPHGHTEERKKDKDKEKERKRKRSAGE